MMEILNWNFRRIYKKKGKVRAEIFFEKPLTVLTSWNEMKTNLISGGLIAEINRGRTFTNTH